ncbi:MAG: hypothetical protein WB007_10445 [Candidatus Acidiferrales bacterium]
MALDAVRTYEFLSDPAGTWLSLTVDITGQIDEATAQSVDSVWHPFLVECLKPYVASGAYLKKYKQ